MKKRLCLLTATSVLCLFLAADGASAETTPTTGDPAALSAKKNGPGTAGEVKKIDVEQGRITIKHGKISNLNMPAMTMVFRVADKNSLKNIQVGDTIVFQAIDDRGRLTVVDIRKTAN